MLEVRWQRVAYVALLATGVLLALAVAFGQEGGGGGGFAAISGALADSEAEIRTGVFPAVAGVLAAVLVIGIAAAVVRVISRNN